MTSLKNDLKGLLSLLKESFGFLKEEIFKLAKVVDYNSVNTEGRLVQLEAFMQNTLDNREGMRNILPGHNISTGEDFEARSLVRNSNAEYIELEKRVTGIEAKGTLNHLTTETNLQFLLDRLTSTHEGIERAEGIWSRSLIEMQKDISNMKDIYTQSQRRQASALLQSRSPQRRQQQQIPYERLMKPQRIGGSNKKNNRINNGCGRGNETAPPKERDHMKARVRPDINPETEEARLQNKKLFRDTVQLKAYAGGLGITVLRQIVIQTKELVLVTKSFTGVDLDKWVCNVLFFPGYNSDTVELCTMKGLWKTGRSYKVDILKESGIVLGAKRVDNRDVNGNVIRPNTNIKGDKSVKQKPLPEQYEKRGDAQQPKGEAQQQEGVDPNKYTNPNIKTMTIEIGSQQKKKNVMLQQQPQQGRKLGTDGRINQPQDGYNQRQQQGGNHNIPHINSGNVIPKEEKEKERQRELFLKFPDTFKTKEQRRNTTSKEELNKDQLIERLQYKLRKYSAYSYSRASELRKTIKNEQLIKKKVEAEIATFDSPAPSTPRERIRVEGQEEMKVDQDPGFYVQGN